MSRTKNQILTKAGASAVALVLSMFAPLAADAQMVASEKRPLSQVVEIREGLIATGIAYEISQVCPDIHPRLIRGAFYLADLEQRARRMGYSKDEVDAFVGDDVQKRELEREARQRLVDLGAKPGDVEGHCTVGRIEMAAGSQIGRLLR